MSFLVDTHVLLWWLADDPKLASSHREIMADGNNRIFVSSVSVAEMSIKASLGKLTIPDALPAAMAECGFDELAFSWRHALQLRTLPWHHRDPFDRMLISQAQVEGFVFLTADPRCREYDLTTR